MSEALIKRQEPLRKIVRNATEKLAQKVAEALSGDDADEAAEELEKAFADFPTGLTETIAKARGFNARGEGPAHEQLLRLMDNERRGGASNPFERAWRGLSDEQKDQIRAEELAYFQRKASEGKLSPSEHNALQAAHRFSNIEISKKDTHMPDFISMTKAINKADGAVINLTQAEYLEMGREKFGKAEF